MIRPSQRPKPDNTQHSQKTDIHDAAGFKPTIPASDRLRNHTLNGATTGIRYFQAEKGDNLIQGALPQPRFGFWLRKSSSDKRRLNMTLLFVIRAFKVIRQVTVLGSSLRWLVS